MTRRVATVPLALTLLLGAVASAAPEDPGVLGVAKTTLKVPVGGSVELDADVFVPQTTGPFPTVVMRHGYARSKANFAGWGQHLASRGFTVVVVTSRAPYAPDPNVDSDDMLAVLAWAVQQHAVAGSALEGKVDSSRRGITGHSAGGLAATLAASKDATLRAAVLFDEVDVYGQGVAAAPGITIPTISLFAEPGNCNASSNGVAIFQAIGGPKYAIKIPGSQHCDPENPSDSLCGYACNGDAQPQYQNLYRRYATAFLEAFLKCDPAAYPYVNGAAAQADTGITIYPETTIVVPPAACGAAADGGAPPGDAGPTDGPGLGDGGLAGDGAAPGADGGLAGDGGGASGDGASGGDAGDDAGDGDAPGGGCHANAATAAPTAALLLALAALLAVARRRRG